MMKLKYESRRLTLWLALAAAYLFGPLPIFTAQENARKAPAPSAMLDQGLITLETPDFHLSLVRSSQTIAALRPREASDFDFTPSDLLNQRSSNGYFHLGDLTLRVRRGNSRTWMNYSTAAARAPVVALPASPGTLAAANLAPTLPGDVPLEITRAWELEDGKLLLRFMLKNNARDSVEIGGLGLPMIFNNVLSHRSLEEAHAKCSFYDPYIGEDAGYLQVTRLNGAGPALIVVPDGKTPFEAYVPILDRPGSWGARPVFTDPTPRSITFEGFYQWQVHSQAYAENEWKGIEEWNPPTSLILKPGEATTYGIKFLVSSSIRGIEPTLEKNRRPVAIGIPGYVLPTDLDGRLFLDYRKGVKSLAVAPEGALSVTELQRTPDRTTYAVRGRHWGRSRLTITYQDGLVQTIQYFVTKPEAETVSDMGHFLLTKQWFVDSNDPFHRSPSVMTYDREKNEIVLQDSRVWIAGLGDEGGGGAWLSAIMKQLIEPDKGELTKLEQFVQQLLWGELQYKQGQHIYGVRKSLFFYQPDHMPPHYYRSDLNWSTWTSWNQKASEQVDRSYDYPHVAAAYWVLYRLARNHHGLIESQSWDWFLTQAYQTAIAMCEYARGLAVFGQMEGDVFLAILSDLKREGMRQQAADLEAKMRERSDRWRREAYPFGSEMPWDSTGQEEVYAWTKYFGYGDKAAVTLHAILGYDPTVPHWGYNGSARRYWDFIFAGKQRRLERQLHHYGSSLNAIPLLSEYREHPDDFYLLRVGYAGTMGALTDIDEQGFASAAFHSFPDMLRPDPITGDYGPNFFGHAWNTACYLVEHPQFGWLSFGGNISRKGETIRVTPLDSARARLYISPLGLWLTLDAGTFSAVQIDSKTRRLRISLDPATDYTPVARLHIEQPAKIDGVGEYHPDRAFSRERDAYVIPLGRAATQIELTSQQ